MVANTIPLDLSHTIIQQAQFLYSHKQFSSYGCDGEGN